MSGTIESMVTITCDEYDRLRAQNAELLAALEDIAYPNPLHNEDDLMRIARAAIAKVEGGRDDLA